MEWYLKCLRQYADFSGRAQRKEYWMFTLFNVIILFCIWLLDVVILISGFSEVVIIYYLAASRVVLMIYNLAVLFPAIAVTTRRLHDTGRSGWWLLLFLVPVVGWIVLFIFMLLKGDSGENEYGYDPLDETGADATSEERYQLDDSCALIHVYRDSIKGAMISYDLHLDDKVIFRVKNRSRATIKVTEDGMKTLWAKTEFLREKEYIVIELGKEYYVRCGIGIGFFVGHPRIKVVDNSTGKFEFDKIKSRIYWQ
jgi:uncharacterized membrane protein YhaH (DUF805 family)